MSTTCVLSYEQVYQGNSEKIQDENGVVVLSVSYVTLAIALDYSSRSVFGYILEGKKTVSS